MIDAVPTVKFRQLRLFPPARPLEERLGRDFFRQLPRAPGVYFMYDGAGRVLYIGQSHDLRERLNSYRLVHPDRDRKRLLRLVHSVDRIEWEVLATPAEAVRREKELLLKWRPRFNRANVWPAPQWFISLKGAGGGIEFHLAKDQRPDGDTYGPFTGACRPAFAAWLRLHHGLLTRPGGLDKIPCGLLGKEMPSAMSLAVPGIDPAIAESLAEALRGRPGDFVSLVETHLLGGRVLSAFELAFWTAQLETLQEFLASISQQTTVE
jgi:hypothetical protein